MKSASLILITLLALAGCASIKVVRVDPSKVDAPVAGATGEKTTGVLFYRPRPYLMVTEAAPAKDQTDSKPDPTKPAEPKPAEPTPQVLSVQIIWLPDYSQEYEIQAHPGLGSVTMNPTLKDGWNLTGLSATADSKTAELITAATGLIGAVPKFHAATAKEKPICPGLYPLLIDRTSGLITGLGKASVIFGDPASCNQLLATTP